MQNYTPPIAKLGSICSSQHVRYHMELGGFATPLRVREFQEGFNDDALHWKAFNAWTPPCWLNGGYDVLGREIPGKGQKFRKMVRGEGQRTKTTQRDVVVTNRLFLSVP